MGADQDRGAAESEPDAVWAGRDGVGGQLDQAGQAGAEGVEQGAGDADVEGQVVVV
ncbi:hypothetical protein ABZ671_32575 [Micromonospora sp. NPDC006766]|uniref:hypothetical protein n=1 Tax=Micromonospora sp. NPDC006766 TaxID=3154778 RepID=UPI0033DAA12B